MKKIVLASALVALVLLSGCGAKKPVEKGIPSDTLLAVKQYVEEGLSEDVSVYTSGVTVVQSNEKLMVSIRTVAVGGSYIPVVASEAVPLAFEKAEECGVEIADVTVNEYSENNSGKVERLISWKTKDGKTGTYANNAGDAPVVETGVSIEELAAMFK